jgi:16S rRNA (cytidine1402-2'-O)-methyltransferase
MCASREISKMYEEHVRGTVEEVLEHFRGHAPRGEFVLVVSGAQAPKKEKKRINKDE